MSNRSHLARAHRPLVQLRKPDLTHQTLVCFHFAGGSAQSYLKWRDVLPAATELVAIETPGHGRRFDEPFAASLSAIAEDVANALTTVAYRAPVFFAHSMGGVLAYETVRALQRCGGPLPAKLIISACPAPNSRVGYTEMPDLSDQSLTAYVTKLNSVPDVVLNSPTQMQYALSILRADLAMLNAYRWSATDALPIPIDVIGALDDGSVSFDTLTSWQNLTTRAFRLTMIDGGHFALFDTPHVIMDRLS